MATYVQVVPASGEAQIRLGQIQRAHLNYVRLDEGSEKLRARRSLESVVADHLSSVPHREKFTCSNFGDVLKRTIDDRADFKASGAAQAFDALERYALNLIMQPWRQEYYCVRLYSGFFKHSVEHYLSNAEEIFRLMGYEPADGMELCLNEPIDPDKVTDSALNCIIAAVECQIMIQVLEKVGGSYSWKEIARVRRHNVCGAEKAADILLRGGGRLNNRLESSKVGADRALHGGSGRRSNGYVRVEKLVDVPGMWTDDLLDSTTMEADERYPASCPTFECGWKRKAVSNGSGQMQRRPLPTSSFDEDFEEALSLMQEDRRRSIQLDDGRTQTRADSWGFVDQSLERRDYNKDYGLRNNDLLRNSATSCRKKHPFPDPVMDFTSLVPSECRDGRSVSYATQKRSRQLPAFAYGRLPSYARSTSYGTPRGMSSMEPTMDDLIQLSNPTSNLGFHPGMISDSMFGATSVSYSTELPPPPPPHQYQHFHPAYASLLQPTSTPQQRSNLYLVDRQCKSDLLTAVPPPPPPPPPAPPFQTQPLPPSGKLPNEHELVDLMSNIRLRDASVLPLVTGSTRDRKSKKSLLATEHRRSTYDNLQDAPPDSSSGTFSSTIPIDMQEVPPPPPPPPPSSSSVTDKRSMNGSASRDVHQSSTAPRTNKANKAYSKDESDGSDVPTSRRSVGQSTTTIPSRDHQHGSSDKNRLTSSTASTSSSSSSSRPRHERSASVGSTRSTSSAKGSSEKSWECWACTFLNGGGRDVCEMCSRSRYKGAESYPLSSGGHECQNCTLVNEKGARKCIACFCNLENSPTYV